MALVKCEKCGRMISDRTKFCPHCGFKQENVCCSDKTSSLNQGEQTGYVAEQEQAKNKKSLIVAVAIGVIVVVGIVVAIICFRGKQNVIVNPPVKDTVSVDTIKPVEEKPKKVIASLNAIGSIERGMLAKVAIPMLVDQTAKGDFYDRVEIEGTDRNITEICYEIVLYKGKEKICSFETDADYDLSNDAGIPSKKTMGNGHIRQFSIYSPSIKFADGIHVGMTAKELVEKHHAKILEFQNPEDGGLNFVLDNYPSNFTFIADGEIVHSKMKLDEADMGEGYLSLGDVRDCKLKQIDF